ncbi:MAG: hypothetical protein JW902_05260 [Syntrophaceae bacterium]|nr:hypothetical protein [Syntrophaceae bacterium]
MLKILFIDDDPSSIVSLKEDIEKEIKDVKHETTGFEQANSVLCDFLPDVVVLDIFRGTASPDGDVAGMDNYQFIWGDWFCPIVVYSARPDDVSDRITKHPFVGTVQKGSDSESKVISCIRDFLPHIEALNTIQADIRKHVNRELQLIASRIFPQIEDVGERSAVLARAARRRIAAMMDEPQERPIASWEQYLYPASGTNLLSGDIIRVSRSDEQDPLNYRIVLTPSCDLVRGGHQTPKVEKALVARCVEISKLLLEFGADPNTRRDKLKDKLLNFLHQGYGKFCLPLPALPGILPPMTVQLKNLELIDLDRIGNNNNDHDYVRVVSVDSPFREMITWAYLQITGRPGIPERDFNAWADEICDAVTPAD